MTRDARPLERVEEIIRDQGIETVVVAGSDMTGILRGKRMSSKGFLERAEGGFGFSDYLFAIDIEEQLIPKQDGYAGWWPSWDTGLEEIIALPDLGTFSVAPWLDRTGIVLCDYLHKSHEPIEISPRFVLHKVVERAVSLGLIPMLGTELEFFLFKETGESLAEKGFRGMEPLFGRGSGYGVYRATLDEPFIQPLRDAMQGMDIDVEGSNPEAGGGQYEVNLVFSALPKAADDALLFKHAVKEVAARQGLMATFMAMCSPAEFGSSCHFHLSLWDENHEQNLFWDEERRSVSKLGLQFVAGQVHSMAEFAAIYAPTVNSYKRYRDYSAAPTTASWGYDNRTTGLRIMSEGHSSTRVENRVPGGDVCLYLAVAATLAGGLYGIENELDPPEAVAGDAYAHTDLAKLPRSLEESLPLFLEGKVAREYLGDELVDFYAATRKWEMESFRSALTDWEVKRYLEYL